MTDEFPKGVDVSSHQDPQNVHYSELAKTHRFVFARATYGTRIDKHFADHIARAKAVGLTVGAYHFFRPAYDSGNQVEVFSEVVTKAGMGTGWMVPALDIERNEQYDGPFTSDRYDNACHSIAELWEGTWGTPLIYTNPGDWSLLGNPTWLKDYLLWLADWTPPDDPPFGMAWTIWQNRVALLPGIYDGKIDQNIAAYLPIIGGMV